MLGPQPCEPLGAPAMERDPGPRSLWTRLLTHLFQTVPEPTCVPDTGWGAETRSCRRARHPPRITASEAEYGKYLGRGAGVCHPFYGHLLPEPTSTALAPPSPPGITASGRLSLAPHHFPAPPPLPHPRGGGHQLLSPQPSPQPRMPAHLPRPPQDRARASTPLLSPWLGPL